MSKEMKKGFAVLLSAAELAKVTGGQDPVPGEPLPSLGDADDYANG